MFLIFLKPTLLHCPLITIFNVFLLQEKATKWTENHEIDGLTTNGVLIMHPRGDFCGGGATCGPWRETSVGGAVFSLRESRSAQQKVFFGLDGTLLAIKSLQLKFVKTNFFTQDLNPRSII